MYKKYDWGVSSTKNYKNQELQLMYDCLAESQCDNNLYPLPVFQPITVELCDWHCTALCCNCSRRSIFMFHLALGNNDCKEDVDGVTVGLKTKQQAHENVIVSENVQIKETVENECTTPKVDDEKDVRDSFVDIAPMRTDDVNENDGNEKGTL